MFFLSVIGHCLPVMYLVAVVSLCAICMLTMRFLYRFYRQRVQFARKENDNRVPVAIVGAGSAGMMIDNEFVTNPKSRSTPVCFFDDAEEKRGKRIKGLRVVGTTAMIPTYLTSKKIQGIVVAMPSASKLRQQEILQLCNRVKEAQIRMLPNETMRMKSQASLVSELRPVQIEDLLGRKPITLNDEAVAAFLHGCVVMVTGGGGSIGSELCRQIAANHPKKLIIIDIYENNAYDIQQELRQAYGEALDFFVEIASVRDKDRIESLFRQYQPEVVFHAAAHKHVPFMETNPQEAVRNNVFGTYNVIMAAHHAGVRKFVQISTDKAVNPTNVMGATKRMCEMIVQSMHGRSKTDYVAVRLGNVLGSNGSVIPLFKRQIAQGGPITVTDKRMIRYFMTIPEATQLVLQAGAMQTRNDILVLDMGEPVKIIDLAENLIRLSGYVPYTEIPIVETGLRPGEKLFEELLVGGDIEKTENDLIYIERQSAITPEELQSKLKILQNALHAKDDVTRIHNNATLRAALHAVVPTFHAPAQRDVYHAIESREHATW